jgi:hypothetical protein
MPLGLRFIYRVNCPALPSPVALFSRLRYIGGSYSHPYFERLNLGLLNLLIFFLLITHAAGRNILYLNALRSIANADNLLHYR